VKKYIQTKNLTQIFDLSIDYFQKRMNKDFIKGIHYFIPPNSSKTKKAVLWDIEALENWFRGNELDDELTNLLARRG
jgi:hypothetical protein